MFKVLVFYEDGETHIDDCGNEYWHSGYVFKDTESEEEMEKLFDACSKALIEKVNEHKESYGMVEVFKGEKDDFECEQEISLRTLRYCNTCSSQIEFDSNKGEIDIWDEVSVNGYRSKLAGIDGIVNEIKLM